MKGKVGRHACTPLYLHVLDQSQSSRGCVVALSIINPPQQVSSGPASSSEGGADCLYSAHQLSESAGNAGQNAQRMAASQSERLLDISERRRTAGDTQEKLVLVWGSAGVA